MMLALKIALRYLFSRKSHSAINLITLVAACGVGIITAAMICMLSVYNGFESLVSDLTSRFDPELRIEPALGKTFSDSDSLRQCLLSHPDVVAVDATLEETVLMSYSGQQVPAHMKGVDTTFAQVTQIDSILLGNEGFLLHDDLADYCILGAGLANAVGINRGFVRPLTVYCPRRVGKINLLDPAQAFSEVYLYCSNIFMVQQSDYDNEYFLCALPVARQLLGDSLLTSAYELRLRPGANADRVKKELDARLSASPTTSTSQAWAQSPHAMSQDSGHPAAFRILTRYEQQADAYRIMQIEKWITFLLVIFILLIASFNAIGALSMLIIDKEAQITTLRNLGADNRFISRIFTFEGWYITGLGAAGGLVLGVTLCLLQEYCGLITLGDGDTSHYVVASYPVVLQWGDVLLSMLTVAAVGWLATWYTVTTVRCGQH